MLGELARVSGVDTPTADQLRQLDRSRAGKRVSNAEWASPTDPEARITRMKDGRTRLAYKPEHAVDLDTGAILAAAVHAGDAGDTQTLETTLAAAATNSRRSTWRRHLTCRLRWSPTRATTHARS
jgi:hypothetical protein